MYNPVHLSDEFAKHTIFKKELHMDFFTASLISTVIVTKLWSRKYLFKSNLKFLAPALV